MRGRLFAGARDEVCLRGRTYRHLFDRRPQDREPTDDFLSRYARGGEVGSLQNLREERRFPGMQPVGIYGIHIVVKNGRTMLLGVVDNSADRQIAEVRAREVSKVFDVKNGLTVVRGTQQSMLA
jgi:hypothetical protein